MDASEKLVIRGIPREVKPEDAAICRSRLATAVNALQRVANLSDIHITIDTPSALARPSSENPQKQISASAWNELPMEQRIQQYEARKPVYTFDQLVVPDEVMERLLATIDGVTVESQVFDQWGLRKIEPYPSRALNLHGAPGTGKTLAAHAIADRLRRDILIINYAEIESKYVGDAPKNINAVFLAAERSNAVLFIDEADSLLSKRLTNVNQGSEQAINSMRSQLFISLDQFRGIVVFATNLVENYDKAFDTRVRHIYFPMPGEQERTRLWEKLLVRELPLHNVSPEELAREADDVCGRDIKNAIVDAATQVALKKRDAIEMSDLLHAIKRIKTMRIS